MRIRTIATVSILLAGTLINTSASAAVVAFDMVGSTSQNLVLFNNLWNTGFASSEDGFQRYRRGFSPSIPRSLLDDSLTAFPGDTLGIIDENNLDQFFGVTDTQNPDNDGPVSATWTFNVSGLTNLFLSIDMGAMGDFELSDTFVWSYRFDGGPVITAFESSVDQAGSLEYTLASGTSVMLDDPMLANGVLLNNQLQTLTTALQGSGNELNLTLTAMTDGGSEAFAFQNIVISQVPLPGAVFLFGSALAVLGLRQRMPGC